METEFVLLTRFNFNLPEFRKVGGLVSDTQYREWLDKRNELFLDVCMKSVLAQVQKPTAWLVGFNGAETESVSPVLKAIERHDWIKPVFQMNNESPLEVIRNEMKTLVSVSTRYVCTSRLDNDDALAIDYFKSLMEAVQGIMSAEQEIPRWITFPFGVQWDGRTCRLFPQNNNAFISYLEDADRVRSGLARTAYAVNHSKLFGNEAVNQVISYKPMWLQNVHSSNVSNKARKKLSVLAGSAVELKRFGLTMQMDACGAAPGTGDDSLDDLGLKWGTDKASHHHDFLTIYEAYLRRMRHEKFTMLEIGVHKGSSLRTWEEYFPNAKIVGVDIKEESRALQSERAVVEIGSGGDPKFLRGLVAKHGRFQLIVDDGSHIWEHQKVAFTTLFPSLRDGGVFIIEDLNTSYFPKWQKGFPGISTVEWLKNGIDHLVSGGMELLHASGVEGPERTTWSSAVDQVIFLKKSAIVIKRS